MVVAVVDVVTGTVDVVVTGRVDVVVVDVVVVDVIVVVDVVVVVALDRLASTLALAPYRQKPTGSGLPTHASEPAFTLNLMSLPV